MTTSRSRINEIIRLRDDERWKWRPIANHFEQSIESVRNIYYRAKAKKVLGGVGEYEERLAGQFLARRVGDFNPKAIESIKHELKALLYMVRLDAVRSEADLPSKPGGVAHG